MPGIRAFVALPTPADVRQRMAAIQAELISANADVKWDAVDKFHITLKFLGDCEQELLSSLAEDLRSALHECRAIDLAYEALGCFPNLSRPRVVWIGTRENAELLRMQEQVEAVCGKFGFKREDRVFHPHITLGRVKGSRNMDRLTERVKSVTFDPMLACCKEVHIMRSELRPTGSVYTLLHSIPLLS